jgi:CheY-like chemotaxis protein/KaiC/GvpD/RAD55 family RecA-like ATPase
MGGLESGELYLIHGEAAGKSLFGVAFLIEGLKRGEQGALVVRCSPEDAVRRFTQLGYDCLEDVFSGRLVIIEYADHLVQHTTGLGQLAPALRELEWLLGASRPPRLVFDPVTSVVGSDRSGLEARVGEFAKWTRQLGSTVVVLADGEDSHITQLFKRHAAESFRFEVREAPAGRVTRFIAFEKSLTLPDQPIQVDPSRGIFLSERFENPHTSSTSSSIPGSDFRLIDIDSPPQQQSQVAIGDADETSPLKPQRDYTVGHINEMSPLELDLESIEDAVARLVEHNDQNGSARPQPPAVGPPQQPKETRAPETNGAEELDLASELFGELAGVFIPGDLGAGLVSPGPTGEGLPMTNDGSEQVSPQPPHAFATGRRNSDRASHQADSPPGTSAEADATPASRPQRARRVRASDLKIDAAMAASAVETLLGRAKSARKATETGQPTPPTDAAAAQNSVDSKSFKVLVINDEAQPCEIIVQSLMDFTIEQINDGVIGLAALISYEPDLVVLDLDLPVAEGFKVLAHIRATLNVPVIIVSSTLAQSSDNVRATESGVERDAGVDQLSKALAASGYYHLTRAFSTNELRDKARQLIARYRGIDAWIISPPPLVGDSAPSAESSDNRTQDQQHGGPQVEWLTPYDDFVTELENRVKAVIDSGSALSVVGCRMAQISSVHGEITEFRLRDVIRNVLRDTDLASTNAPGEVVILLGDARATGARAFASRLRETVAQTLNQEPSVWIRSFPELEETRQAAAASAGPTNGRLHNRRASDRQVRA